MRNALRLLLALLFGGWGQQALAVDYYWWVSSYASVHHASPLQACEWLYGQYTTATSKVFTKVSDVQYTCRIYYSSGSQQRTLYREGDGCSTGSYNPATDACENPAEACPAVGTSVGANVPCTYDQGTGSYTHSDSIAIDGCGYVTQPGGYFKAYPDYNNPANTFCVARFASTGDFASPGSEDVPEEQAVPFPNENPDLTCTKYGPHTICQSASNPACGTYDGGAYCTNESDTCGVFGAGEGTFQCIPKSGSRTCSYIKGVFTCVDKGSNTVIPPNSADHPNNGGNADGNPNNDEQAPGNVTVGGGAQGTDKGATNKAIADLQGALTDRLDAIGDALTGDTPSSPGAPVAPNERGSFDLEQWDQKIEDAKLELATLTNEFGELFQGVTAVNLSGSGGQLYCNSFTVMNRSYDLCLSQYAEQLAGIGTVILFLAALLAAYIIFIRE